MDMTFEKAMTIGKRWQKGNMDRIYINITEEILNTEASTGVRIGNFFNRYERQNLKVYFDVTLDSLVISTGNAEAKKELTAIIETL